MPPRIGLHRLLASGTLALLHLVLAVAYAVPGLTTPPPAVPGRLSIVLYLDSLGPVWQVGFGTTGAFLLVGLWRTNLLSHAHTLASIPVAIYAAALWLGFAFSSAPKPSIVSALLTTAVMMWHPTIGVTYARLTAATASPPLRSRGGRRRAGRR